MKLAFVIIFSLTQLTAQNLLIPEYYKHDQSFSDSLLSIVKDLELDKDFDVGEDGIEQISFAVIDLTGINPVLGGVNPENFIYPASVYKMYVAAEVLNQISNGDYSLYESYTVKSPNDVDLSKQIDSDPRPLLKDGDTVTINYLLDLMITRSDNTAANCLIDIATRPKINELMHKYGWQGSEVTRKFLKRKFEDEGYAEIKGTETSALHAADFMCRIETNQLISSWVSLQMKALLGRQLDKSKIAQGLPQDAMYYHKTGWWSYWTNDVGIVDDGKIKYIISCFMPLEEELALPKFKILSAKVYDLIKSRIKD
ncbi:MAG TPA: serine hydrolase [Ignavibacteriaceae bacterium]|nr:serine hydrolase [Ignavibacteriaceae bacterium]